jgi:transcriptional regulator with XRE-family HTH domain
MSGRITVVDPNFGRLLKELREERRLSFRRLAGKVHCSHSHIDNLERGDKNPSVALARLLDVALGAGGTLSAMVVEVSADSGVHLPPTFVPGDPLPPGLEFAPDWRHGVEVAAELWRGDMQRRQVLRGVSFAPAAYLAPAMRWLISPLDDRPVGDGQRLVGEPDVETVRRITNVYRTLDNQYGGGHVRESVVRFLDGEVAGLLRGRYDAGTGRALLSAAAEATQLAGWASYDCGLHGLAQRYMVQALRLAAAARDRALGAEILAAMSHQAAYLHAAAEAVDLARAAGRAAKDAGVAAIQAESAVLEAQGHASGGDEKACATSLDRAEKALDRADRTSDPQWIGYFDESYLAAKFGHCFTALGRGDLAERFAAKSLDMDGRHYARGRQFNLALLAVAYAQAGDPERASVVGADAVDAAEGLDSVRAGDYLADLAQRLAPYAGVVAVDAFTRRARPVLQRLQPAGQGLVEDDGEQTGN